MNIYKVIETHTFDEAGNIECVWYSATKIDRTNEEVVNDGISGYESGSHTGLIWQDLAEKGYCEQTTLFTDLTRSEARRVKDMLVKAAGSRYLQGKTKVMVLNDNGRYLKAVA